MLKDTIYKASICQVLEDTIYNACIFQMLEDTIYNARINQVLEDTIYKLQCMYLPSNKPKSPELREIAYKAIVWDPYIQERQEDIQRIEMVQRRADRWVLSFYSTLTTVSQDMLGQLGCRTLEQ